MKKTIFLLTLILSTNYLVAQQKVELFHLDDVRVLSGPFKNAEELDKNYLLTLEADKLLAPYLREAGLPAKTTSYGNWENTGLDGHIGGHYVSALSMMYAATGDIQIKDRLDYVLEELKACQQRQGTGYLGGVPGSKELWDDIAHGKIQAGSFDLNKKWVPLYNIHKIYAGLRDAYLFAHNQQAKEMLIKMSDWFVKLVENLTDEQIQNMLRSEHGGLNEVFADVAAITGNEKYLKLARQFSHEHLLKPLLAREDRLTGMHANTQIPKVLGFKRIAEVENNSSWEEAARFFWEKVVQERTVSFGGNSAFEHFHPANDFTRMLHGTEGPETCNTYNMLRLSNMLYRTSLNERYIDYYERGLYNHILSSQHPEHGGLVYFTQIRPGHYRVYSQPHTSMWCCVGSGIENHAKYGELIYAKGKNDIYVNLFIPSKLNWKEKEVELIQQTRFPEEERTTLIINTRRSKAFQLHVRYPSWVKKGEMQISVNGKKVPVTQQPGSYISINRKWKKGDKVVVELPMEIRAEQLPDHSNYFSFMYGPIVLAAKTDTTGLVGLKADDSRGGHIARGPLVPLKDMPVVISNKEQLASVVTKMPNKVLTFRLNSLYPQEFSNGFELIPFYQLHDARYIIYWAQATREEVEALQQKIEEAEKERMILESVSVDKVVCGEQQPESDHFIESQRSDIGDVEGVHFRDARGWFSYQLRNVGQNGRQLRVAFTGAKWPREAEVWIGDVKVGEIKTTGEDLNKTLVREFNVPENFKSADTFRVRISAKGNSTTPRIFEVRLLK